MASKIITLLIDDLTGKEVEDGETLRFTFEGATYEIDLSKSNAAKMRKDFGKYAEAGRKVSAPRAAAASRGAREPRSTEHRDRLTAIREWAKKNGYEVSDRGRVARQIVEMYDLAMGA